MTPGPAKPVTQCRVCGSPDLSVWFSLGEQPLANALLDTPISPEDTFPLAVQRCQRCQLSQLTRVVDPEVMFSTYCYLSGASRGWHTHCQGLVAIVEEHFPNAKFALDIASNDGTLLSKFNARGFRTLGVEPATNLACQSPGPVLNAFWSEDTAEQVLAEEGKADVIVAQNVLGHVDDVRGFLRAIKMTLAPGGTAFLEVPDVGSLLGANAFDTIYHEHLSYWSLLPLRFAAVRAGLQVVHVDSLAVHGGSLRFWLQHEGKADITVTERASTETRGELDTSGPYKRFAARVDIGLIRLRDMLESISAQGNIFWGYGAPAKGNVLLNELRRRGAPLPEVLVDDASTKQGKYTPGTHLPIEKPRNLKDVDVLLVTSWNWLDGIKARAKELGFQGQYLVPLPTPRLE